MYIRTRLVVPTNQERMQKHDADLDLDSRFRWAARAVDELRSDNPLIRDVFDIGSGNEILAESIKRTGLDYKSFDIAPATETVRQWNIEEPFPYSDRADVVVLLEVVDHLNNPWLGLRNVAEVLRPGGHLILSTPNPSWSGSRLTLLGRGVLAMFTDDDLVINHHVFTPWRHVIHRLLADSSFSSITFTQLGKKTNLFATPFWGIKLPLRIAFRLVKIFLETRDPEAVGALYGVIAQKGVP